MSEFDLGTGLLGKSGVGSSGRSYMQNLFGSRYRGYGTTEIGDSEMTSGMPSLRGGLGRSQSVMEMFLAVTRVTNDRDKIYQALLEVEDYSIVQMILEIMRDDVITPDESTKEVFALSSFNPQYDSILKGMNKRLALEELIIDICADILLFGEYPYKVVTRKDHGIISLDELANPTDITPIYKGRQITRFLVRSQGQNDYMYSNTSFESYSPYDYITFLRYPRKVRLNTREQYPFLIDGLVKVGRSIFPLEALEKIKSLYLLEKMLPISRILQMNKSTIVGVQLGQSMMTKAVIEACNEYERYLNSSVSSSSALLDADSVIASIGKYKVIPIVGEQGKIVDQSISSSTDHSDAIATEITDIKNSIVSSVGLLPSYVFGDKDTVESLKSYIRYLRKLDSVQQCMINGIKHLSLIELYAHNENDAVASDINVTFSNNISLANIEKLEFLDILVSMLDKYRTFMENLAIDPTTVEYIDKVQMLSFIKRKLSYMKGAEAAINIKDSTRNVEKEDATNLQEDTFDIDEILKKLPKNVKKEISNNINKVQKEIKPINS